MAIYLLELFDNTLIETNIANKYNYFLNLDESNELYVKADEATNILETIKTSIHTLLRLPVNQKIATDVDLDWAKSEISEIITHDVVRLVSDFRKMPFMSNLQAGNKHNQLTAAPYTNSKRIKADTVNFSEFENIKVQSELFKNSENYKYIYRELKQMCFGIYEV